MPISFRTILIAGAGQLGSRYLQGMAKCNCPLKIYVYDVNASSLIFAQKRWNEVLSSGIGHEVIFTNILNVAEKVLDIVIVATTADVRPEVVEIISKNYIVRHWILEKVLAQSELGLSKIQACIDINGRAWVNTPRRITPWYREIKKHLIPSEKITIKATGSSWGLASNSVHLIDLLAWWSGETLLTISTDNLDQFWVNAKKLNNWEVNGTLEADFSGGSCASLASFSEDTDNNLKVFNGNFLWDINEANGIALRSDGVSIPGRLLLQSEMTASLVDELLDSGQCELPSLKESIDIHRVFIGSMLNHWRFHVDSNATFLPIT